MTGQRRTALIVTYAFPPNGAVGSMRPLRWCRWLPRVSAWSCAVLTVDREPARRDGTLLESLPPDVPVVRTPVSEPWYRLNPPDRSPGVLRRAALRCLAPALEPLATPDPQVFWRRTMVPAGCRLARELGVDVVVVTAPPWSSLLGAASLARRARRPLVIDFRDPWTEIDRGPMSAWRSRWERRAERQVCAQAAVAISTSDTYSANLRARCPGVPADRFVTLHNGFDEEAFAAAPDPGVAPTGLTVVHLGSLYARRQPFAALAGMRRWLDTHPERAAQFRLVFVGTPDGATRRAVADNGLEPVCEMTGHVPHAEAIARCRAADLLLLAMGDTTLTPAGWLPSKLFEYLAIHRPVLAHTVEGEAAGLLRAAGAAAVVAGCDPAAFADALERHWQAKHQLGHAVPHRNLDAVVGQLRQESLASRLAGILDRAAGTPA
ncbi:MAG TPA: glycosyltransferase [Candidatus Krumholzibacteria bacterium]|nr:glycosyltransferase [Candidatus Krumholzibacteria bacterium]HPD72034.1 glycosyltransferase [Candidatus Krumholzibacteria bacterium]HRY41033.1 glycosyltransferase [Candidatus Krumholzibacteria bacterium]